MIKKQENSFLFDEIVSIVPVGKKQTYDFTVPKTHSFFANDVLCHNSGGIGEAADAILLLSNVYRKTKLDADKGRFEILIEQRYGDSGIIKCTADLGTSTFADSIAVPADFRQETKFIPEDPREAGFWNDKD